MKSILMILGLALCVLTSGCGGMYGRGGAGGVYGPSGNGSMGYGSTGGYGTPMGSPPMVGMPGTSTGLPPGARGRISPYGGDRFFGTAYANPEIVVAADRTRSAWRDPVGATVPVAPVVDPCADGDCPPPPEADPRDARIEALEDQVVELLARDAD